MPRTRLGLPARWPKRDDFIRKGICPCDPTRGDGCRLCDGTAADEREAWRARRNTRRGPA